MLEEIWSNVLLDATVTQRESSVDFPGKNSSHTNVSVCIVHFCVTDRSKQSTVGLSVFHLTVLLNFTLITNLRFSCCIHLSDWKMCFEQICVLKYMAEIVRSGTQASNCIIQNPLCSHLRFCTVETLVGETSERFAVSGICREIREMAKQPIFAYGNLCAVNFI